MNMKTRLIVLIIPFFLLISFGIGNAQSFKQALTGKRLILKGNQCSGWQFKDASTALRYDEMICSRGSGEPSFEVRVLWITQDQFLFVESSQESGNPGCPPRIWLYKVESLASSKATLREIWLGWGKGKDSIESYRVQN